MPYQWSEHTGTWTHVEPTPEQAAQEQEAMQVYQSLFTSKKRSRSLGLSYAELYGEKDTDMEMPLNCIFPYNDFSKGARALAKELGWKRPKRSVMPISRETGQTLKGPFTIINWGATKLPSMGSATYNVLNGTGKVQLCSDKVKFFEKVKDQASVPEFTTDLTEALSWVEAGEVVMGRQRKGSCGQDIAFHNEDLEAFSQSDFWVKYKKKKQEFRVHIAFGDIIRVQRKALRKTDVDGKPIDTSNVDFRIRNLGNGFVFVIHDGTPPPSEVLDQAKRAYDAVGLDFGAVDVIYNQHEDKAYVLEINTAPGLEGTTVSDYANAFRQKLGLDKSE